MFSCISCNQQFTDELKVKGRANLCKPCKNVRSKQDYRNHREKRLLSKKQSRLTEHGQKIDMLSGARKRAKQKGIPFELKIEDLPAIPEYCPIFPHIKLERGIGKINQGSPSLDRIVPTLGYVPGNIQIISSRANTLKNDGTLEEFQMILQWMKTQ